VESNAIQWATASLSDRFTNSGIICSVVAQQQDEIMNIRNLTLSCRALGRGIEKQIVSKTLLDLISRNSSTSISIPWVRGPRNSEFFNWAKAMRPSASFEEDEGVLILSKPELERAVEFESKKIEWL
jgi:predicted enzyme involved in methoxymalonyl-ACP biosynthesis